MSWYKTGQIAVTNGSRVIVGVGTNFTRFVEVGEALLGPDGQHYEITSVPSATELRIGKNYAGPTAANQSYTIVPVQGYVRELAHKAADLIDAHKGVPAEALSHAEAAAQSAAEAQAANIGVKEARDAAAESAASAAASATAAAGTVSQVADLASQAQTSATAASGSATSASSSKTAAEAAATSATASATQANASKVSAEASATSASTSATAAANSSSQALAHSESAAVSATTARTAADEAVTSNQSAGASATAAGNSATQSQTSATAAAASAAEALSSAQSAASSRADAEAAAVSAQNRAALAAGYASSSTSSASEAAISAAKSTASATEAASSATAAANSSAQALTRANAAGASATLAEQSSQTAQAFKAAAEASAGAAADSAADSAAAASLSEGFSIQAGESASDAAASALLAQNANAAAQAEAAIVQAASTSAQAAATAASTSATNAATSADAASQSELASGMSEIAAAASEASAQAAKTTAELAKNAAASSAVESAASAAAALASKEGAEAVVNTVNEARDAALAHTATAKAWADKVDGEVEPGKYSARYWAEITAGAATGGVVYMGTWSAAGGVFPINPDRGHLYKVSVAGEIAGEGYSVKDMIIFNGESWDKIDSTDEVTSVAGRVGAVLLTKADVGLENVDNTADLAKPVSAAQQAALNQKQDTLVSGESIKRLNGESLLGSGDVTISKSSLGLENVDNTADLDKPVSTAQRAALDQKQNNLVTGANLKTVNGQDLLGAGDVAITKGDVGLANVDNTSDADKPVSTAQREALDRKQDTLVSGESIKTLNGAPLLGGGNITLDKATLGLGSVDNTADMDKPVSMAQQAALDQKQNALVSGENIKTINGMSILGGGDIVITNGDELAVPRLNSLLVYYGYPIAYKGIWNADAIVAEISASHDYWIVGHTYQDPAHEEYASTVAIMRGVRAAGVKLYGYIPLGTNSYNYTVAQIEAITDQWMAIGVDGIFIDEYGFDYGNTRQRQVDVVNMIHTKGLPICANAWVMEEFVTDSLAETGWPSGDWKYVRWQEWNPTNIPSPAQPGDSYLFENFCYDHLGPTAVWDTQERAEMARALALQNDVSVWGLAVFAETTPGTLDTAKLGNLATLPAAGEYISANAYLYDINVVGSGGFSFGSNGTPLWAPLRQLSESAQLPASPAENNYTDKTGVRFFGPVRVKVTNTATIQAVEVTDVTPLRLGEASDGPGGIEFVRKTAAVTLADKQGIIADTSGGSFTVKLPASPVEGTQVFINDGANWAVNNLTVDPQGKVIENLAAGESLILNAKGLSVQFLYDSFRWHIYVSASGIVGSDYVTRSGATMQGALNWATPVEIASAATTSIGQAASNRVRITGTTTITGLGTTAPGASRTVTFTGALTLTHNATSLILPGGANITTAAGDVAEFESLGAGNWRCTGYMRANGQAVSVSPLPNTITKTVANPGTSSFTASPGNHYLIWSVITATLPTTPAVGDTIYFTSYITGWTIARNGKVISGVAEDLVVDIGGPGKAMKTFGLRFIEAGANVGWVII